MIDDPSTATPPESATDSSSTGDARVDAVTSGLDKLDALPVSDHVEHYADVHSQLQDILNDVGSPASRAD